MFDAPSNKNNTIAVFDIGTAKLKAAIFNKSAQERERNCKFFVVRFADGYAIEMRIKKTNKLVAKLSFGMVTDFHSIAKGKRNV